MLGPENASGFIRNFSSELEQLITQLLDAQQQPQEVGNIAHHLISVAGTLGFDELSLRSQELRVAVRSARCAEDFACEYDAAERAAREIAAQLATLKTIKSEDLLALN